MEQFGENLTYNNIEQKLNYVYTIYPKPCIIAIDSAISYEINIGRILISNKKMKLGQSLDKNKYNIGDISIKGIVAKKQDTPFDNYIQLKNTPNYVINKMVRIVSNGIDVAIKNTCIN